MVRRAAAWRATALQRYTRSVYSGSGAHLHGLPIPALLLASGGEEQPQQLVYPDFHFSFDSANHRMASDAFIDAGWKALKALRRSTPNG